MFPEKCSTPQWQHSFNMIPLTEDGIAHRNKNRGWGQIRTEFMPTYGQRHGRCMPSMIRLSIMCSLCLVILLSRYVCTQTAGHDCGC